MASLGEAVISRALRHSAAEQAFRPWWDNFEDFLIYGLVLLGLIVLPTAIINSTPLDCTLCRDGLCPNNGSFNFDIEDPGYNAWWIKKYCTFTAVDGFVLYFPYFLLIMALVMLLIERGFIQVFKAGLKLDAFYNLLVSESILDTAVTTSTNDKQQVTGAKFLELQDTKMVFEVAHSFSQSSSYFYSYMIRTVAEFIVAACLLTWLCLSGLPTITKDEYIYCPINQVYLYQCSGHPQKFYLYVLFATIVILGLYLFSCTFNILWLLVPQFGSLSGVMRNFRSEFRKARLEKVGHEAISDQELLGDLYDVYYNNRDLKLLLDLLATSSGIAPCLRLLCLFDRNLRKMAEVANLHVNLHYDQDKDRSNAVVKFDDPPAMKDLFSKIPGAHCIYTVEIIPSITSGSIHALKYKTERPLVFSPKKMMPKTGTGSRDLNNSGDVEMVDLDPVSRKRTKFKDIDPTVEYSFRVCTLINGKTISRKIITLKPPAEDSSQPKDI